jgi:hypothetical protein
LPWSFVQVLVVVVVCAAASPAPASSTDPVTIENNDFRMAFSFWGYVGEKRPRRCYERQGPVHAIKLGGELINATLARRGASA